MSSKIKVDTIENVAGSGNVSLGSGHNLVVPGNITGQGTAAITSNATVGGTLDVTGNTTVGGNVISNDGSNVARFQFDNDNQVLIQNDTLMSFYVNGNNNLKIDSGGRITKPNQPYFAAHMTGNAAYQSRTAGNVFPFNTAVVNTGSHFDTSNKRFTAPVNGKYLFTASFITNDSTPEGRIMFYVNGAEQFGTIRYGINGSNTGGGGGTNAVAIIQLSASDYVDVRNQSGTTQFYENEHSSFTGILMA